MSRDASSASSNSPPVAFWGWHQTTIPACLIGSAALSAATAALFGLSLDLALVAVAAFCVLYFAWAALSVLLHIMELLAGLSSFLHIGRYIGR